MPAERCRRQLVSVEEYNPSRRKMAETPPVSAIQSVSFRMPSFYFAAKRRRFGVAVISAAGPLGAVTTRAGGIAGKISHPASGESGIWEGITMGSVSFALKRKLQTVKCLKLIGTEGAAKKLGNAVRISMRSYNF